MTDNREHVHTMLRYDHWANAQIMDVLRNQPTDVLDKQVASSFPSLRRTFLHI